MARLVAILLALLLGAEPAAAVSWTVADGSAIRFEAYQQGAPVPGRFERFTGDIVFDPADLAASRIAVEIDAASIATGHTDRDTVLRSPNLFDVARWPRASFVSTRLEHLGGDAYRADGELTIRDVRKDVVLPFTLRIADHPGAHGELHAEAFGELAISRLDYGVGQGEWASTAMVGESVVISFEIVATAPR